jgi:hypothetical protein
MAGIKVPAATRVLIARLDPEQVGREFPLSAEKLSPILAFYSVANLAGGIALCHRLLEFGGLGHTCSIHSQNRAAILEFGAAMPAFRVVVNSASVHGSIGYSTNLFPAMTLGCGAPGGNITSDNIGPQHLMNVKRIAWEARGVEHRTVPAGQRMAGAAIPGTPEAVQEKVNLPVAQPLPVSTPESKAEEKKIAVPPPAPRSSSVDRAAIARVVAQVLSAQGVARGSGAPKATATATSIAAEIADRFFGASAKFKSPGAIVSPVDSPNVPEATGTRGATFPDPGTGTAAALSPKAAIEVQVFVSENDVRRAMTRSEKIFIGRKTILTPSARDLGMEHEVFVETEAGSLR